MNKEYLAGVFDCKGYFMFIKNKVSKNAFIGIKINSSCVEMLEEIARFLNFGVVTLKNSSQSLNSFTFYFTKREDVKTFLNIIKEDVIIKKKEIEYIFNNYDFEENAKNYKFDVEEFRRLNL